MRERDRNEDFYGPGGFKERQLAKLKAAEEAEKRREAKALREEDARRAREEADKEARDKVKAKRDALVKKLEQARVAALGGANVQKPPPKRAKKASPCARKTARKPVRKPTAAKKSPASYTPPGRRVVAGDRTKANGYSEAGRKPRCTCTHKRRPKCKISACPNFGIPKLGSPGKYYHPQWMLDRRP
jgi:hypothetical protein